MPGIKDNTNRSLSCARVSGQPGLSQPPDEIQPPKDWEKSRDGGPRKIVREDLRLVIDEVEPGGQS